MNFLKKQISLLLVSLFLWSCQTEQKVEDHLSVSKQGAELLQEIKPLIYSDREKSLLLAKQLQGLENDSISNLLGDYYLALSNYSMGNTESNFQDILKVYDLLKQKKMYSYMFTIDYLALNRFYFDNEYEFAKKEIRRD